MLPIDIEVENVKSLIDNRADFLLVDCREDQEREIAKIESAIHIPMNQTIERIHELEAFREKQIVIHCHHGGRSRQVTEYLRAQGFDKVQNMAGGIEEWSQRIDESIARY